MKKKTSEKASLLVEFNACRSSTHGDHSQKTQLRGNKDRVNIAEDVILKLNGSSQNYIDTLPCANVKNVPKVEVIRKIISEYMNKEMVSTCWITNAHCSIDYKNQNSDIKIK